VPGTESNSDRTCSVNLRSDHSKLFAFCCAAAILLGCLPTSTVVQEQAYTPTADVPIYCVGGHGHSRRGLRAAKTREQKPRAPVGGFAKGARQCSLQCRCFGVLPHRTRVFAMLRKRGARVPECAATSICPTTLVNNLGRSVSLNKKVMLSAIDRLIRYQSSIHLHRNPWTPRAN
jgi:hypothetical protein